MIYIKRLAKAWEIFKRSNPYQLCDGIEFRAITNPDYCMGQMIDDTLALLKEQEAIIRCKDCTYRGEINCPQYYRWTDLSDDYFCADGERSDDDG